MKLEEILKKTKWSLEKTDPGGDPNKICIYYRFPKKTGNAYRLFMQNKRQIKGVYILFLYANALES